MLAPGVVAGLVPWWLTGWNARDPLRYWAPLEVGGWIVLAAGVAVLAEAFVRFVIEGRGTPAPIAPTERLIVGGLYRYVRNPMYLAVGATVVGQALVLGQLILLLYAAAFAVAVAVFVRWYEEPTLRRQSGSATRHTAVRYPPGGRGACRGTVVASSPVEVAAWGAAASPPGASRSTSTGRCAADLKSVLAEVTFFNPASSDRSPGRKPSRRRSRRIRADLYCERMELKVF
jgi:protein-S-isoprenylcysteine O-methyltransferase Ste14